MAFWRICAKAGYPGALGPLVFLPVADLLLVGGPAFGEWPIHREMRDAGLAPPDA